MKKVWILWGLLFISEMAMADFYVEPFVSAILNGSAEYKIKDSIPGVGVQRDQANIEGSSYGLGIGYHFPKKIILGFDLEIGQFRYKSGTVSASTIWSQSIFYGILGYEFDKDAFLYVGTGSLAARDDQSPSTTMRGSALKAGLAYKFGPHLKAFVEYAQDSWSQSTTSGFSTVVLSDYYDSYTHSTTVFGLRFPFELGR